MASFEGHALPGFCFVLLGLFFAFEITWTNFGPSKQNRIASILMVSLSSIGILLELFWPVNNEPPFGRLVKPGSDQFYKPMNWQHSTMYFFFLTYGSSRLLSSRFPVLTGLDRLAGALAFGVEGYLFYNHVHGRSPLDTKIHLLITLICVSTALVWTITFFMENKRKIFILDLIIAILVFAQGTWFWHVAIILYGKNPWVGSPALGGHMHDSHMNEEEEHHDEDHDEHMEMDEHMDMEHMDEEHINTMFAVLFFAWHIAAAILFISVISFLVYKFMEKRGTLKDEAFGIEQNNNANSSSSKLSKQSRFGDYKQLEVDETPLLQSVEDEENVLFSK